MRNKTNTIFKGVILMLSLFCVGFASGQNPISKPKRPTTTQQTKPQTSKQHQSQSCKQVVSGTINGHDYVDLGLSVKWATCNIGASSPSDYGNYYAWGETSTKSNYTRDNSKWRGVPYPDLQSQNVIDSRGNLRSQYDAARQNWGSSWRMPTKGEIDELINRCKWKWTSQGGKNGHKVTGPNGNSIFLPAAGYRDSGDLSGAGSYVYYWSATAYGDASFAYYLYFNSSGRGSYNKYRSYGLSIRPVTE